MQKEILQVRVAKSEFAQMVSRIDTIGGVVLSVIPPATSGHEGEYLIAFQIDRTRAANLGWMAGMRTDVWLAGVAEQAAPGIRNLADTMLGALHELEVGEASDGDVYAIRMLARRVRAALALPPHEFNCKQCGMITEKRPPEASDKKAHYWCGTCQELQDAWGNVVEDAWEDEEGPDCPACARRMLEMTPGDREGAAQYVCDGCGHMEDADGTTL